MGNLGGDEFGIILQRAEKDQIISWSKSILAKISNHDFNIDGHELSITACIGIAFFSVDSLNGDELLVQGENALFQAKEEGANEFAVFSPGGGTTLDAPWSWKYRLRRALEKEQFKLHFQPIIDLHKNQVIAYEVLLRLIGEDGELVSPSVFLPWAERYGMIREIDRWVMQQALGILSHNGWAHDILLSVNISGQTLTDAEFRRMLSSALERKLIGPGSIALEITETAAVTNLNEAKDFIDTLKTQGPAFALDDFGSGFSSLSYLKHLPVDVLKIDGSFIRDIIHNPVDQELVKFMVAVAKSLNKKTVAEFVENRETLDLLREYGVDYAQGFYIGKPGEFPNRPEGSSIG